VSHSPRRRNLAHFRARCASSPGKCLVNGAGMSDVASGSRLSALGEFARREPGKCLAVVLALHLVIWTALPALLSQNLQLDLVEDLPLGPEWQLGYWKHPPLPWWAADAIYRATGSVYAVYLLGPLSAVA